MLKNQLMLENQKQSQRQYQIPKKACFGTKEFSQNSGICNRCNHREECGKKEGKGKG